MAMTQALPPKGWVEIDPLDTWQVGHIFTWSDVFGGWLRDTRQCNLSIRPGESVGEAYHRQNGEQMPSDTFAFASEEF